MRDIAAALARVHERIAAAAARAGRDPAEITLVAVSKGMPATRLMDALACGQRDLGENRVGELAAKRDALAAEADRVRWHFVGRLQRNKVGRLLGGPVHLVHSVDRVELARELARRAAPGSHVEVLLEVNTSGERAKGGVPPEELPALADGVSALVGVRVHGLMTMAPRAAGAQDARACFRRVASIRDELAVRHGADAATHLSMGMSGDFEIAVEEGATLVRVGTAIFGPREGGDDRAGALAPASLR